ncbi:MAG: type II toxin-antitoxin system RelE/ParE family toxin [Actinomycetota bacterium]|nr:type II toxin-antitoxin system RelE/ParE family toxin [Actinomycetota bacterium]
MFVSTSDDDLRAFPVDARREAGYQLFVVQSGQEPSDWKPMPTIGPGCREIRIRADRNAYRVFFVATVGEVVYVLHCFQKTTQRTARADIGLGQQRYKQMTALIRDQEKP